MTLTTHFTVRIDAELYRDYQEVVEREERDVSKDIRLYIRRKVERAKRDAAAKAQGVAA